MVCRPIQLAILLGFWPSGAEECICSKSGLQCFYDSSCPGLGCGAEGQSHCRFCGDPKGLYGDCPKEGTPRPKAAKAEQSGDTCPCSLSANSGLRCFYDESCPGLGCGAHGHLKCRFCGDDLGHYLDCPDPTSGHSSEKLEGAEADKETKAEPKKEAEPEKEAKEEAPEKEEKEEAPEEEEEDEAPEKEEKEEAPEEEEEEEAPEKEEKEEAPEDEEEEEAPEKEEKEEKEAEPEKEEKEQKEEKEDELEKEDKEEDPDEEEEEDKLEEKEKEDKHEEEEQEEEPKKEKQAEVKKDEPAKKEEAEKEGRKEHEKKPAKPDKEKVEKQDNPEKEEKPEHPAEKEDKPEKEEKPAEKDKKQTNAAKAQEIRASVRLARDDPCQCSSTGLRCFYDDTCPGLGCGAQGKKNCRFCGDEDGQFHACPDADASRVRLGSKGSGHNEAKTPVASAAAVASAPAAAPAAPAAATAAEPKLSDAILSEPFEMDFYRSMAAAAVDTHPMEDDDIADMCGALKYVHTEILTEHLQSPIRQTRKYSIDVLTRHRMKIKNPNRILGTPNALQGEFGQFITYDFGKATNPAQLPMIQEQGNFVGVAPCTALKCDVRYPSPKPYSWFSVGNWCPNLAWNKKGSKAKPNPRCLKSHHGHVIVGGLPSNGFGSRVLPTGAEDSVYTYDKAVSAKLDDIVGITSEMCGKKPCKDWLDFRMNCSNRERYGKKFSMDGKVEPVDYCVEFDIHPDCEANCEAPACKTRLKKGGVYLGLPFWHGRCDARANERRCEMVGTALGIPGALEKHSLVDPTLLTRACPASKDSSWSCVPSVAYGFAGPFCTRSYTGACDRCFIPGAESPTPVDKPWCPRDILKSATYKDHKIQFKCKSNMPSHICCLYTGTCKGDSEPLAAELTDDGLELVAARKSTEDMEIFLKRALAKHPHYSNLPLSDGMKWAAYFAWDDAPQGRSLEEVLIETKMFLSSENYKVAKFTTTTTTLPSVQGTPAGECFENSVSFIPLDMPGTMASTSSLSECQARCAKTSGCFHFSHLDAVQSCHLHGFSALAQVNSIGWTSGPPECWKQKKAQEKGLMISKPHETYVKLSFACMKWGSSFSPPLANGYSMLTEQDEMKATLECQKKCLERDDCEHFTVSFPIRSCVLVGKDATAIAGIAGAISGPAKCEDKAMQSYYWEVLPRGEQLWRPNSPASLTCIAFVGLGGLSALAWLMSLRYPACSSRTVQQICYREAPSSDSVEHEHEWREALVGQTPVDCDWDVEMAPME